MKSVLLRGTDSNQNVKEENVVGADSAFFDMFGIHLIAGDPKRALSDPYSLVLTKSAAEKHFQREQVVGEQLILNDRDVYQVTGVMEDMPRNSFLRDYNVFISLESFEDAKSIAWNNWNFPTFVKLTPKANIEDFQAYISTVTERYLIPWAMTFIPGLTLERSKAADKESGNFMRFNILPLTKIHLYAQNRKGEFNANSRIENVYILSIIGLFLIILACVNFMNLSTVQFLSRSKEVGIRKTLGSSKMRLVRQFLTEAGLISCFSVCIAIIIGTFILPYFNDLAEKSITIPFQKPIFWGSIVLAILLLSLISGTYPSFFMSRFKPIGIINDTVLKGQGNRKIRDSLVVFQFAISLFLIVCTFVVFQQVTYIQNKDLGFHKEQILILEDVDAAGEKILTLKEEILSLATVESASLSSFLPTPSDRNGITFFPEGKVLSSESALIIGKWNIDHDYIKTLGLEIVAGRGFDKSYPTDSSAIILNETAVKMMGIGVEKAIGLRMTSDFHRKDKENMKFYTVIGVVKNFHFESLRSDIHGLSLTLGDHPNRMAIKLNQGDFTQSIAAIKSIWEDIAASQPFNYYFMDESFDNTYRAELRLGKIFFTFTMLSIFIACLGLFGLAAYNVERRLKEISIRKVLGASFSQIVVHLSFNFIKLIGISIFIALPLSWLAMTK